jgi:hypothetical protein
MIDSDILKLGAAYGLSNLIIGYDDFEAHLLAFAKVVQEQAYDLGVMTERALMNELYFKCGGEA